MTDICIGCHARPRPDEAFICQQCGDQWHGDLQAVRPSREQAEALQRVIDGLLGGLDLSAEQRAKVPAALTEAVRREGLL